MSAVLKNAWRRALIVGAACALMPASAVLAACSDAEAKAFLDRLEVLSANDSVEGEYLALARFAAGEPEKGRAWYEIHVAADMKNWRPRSMPLAFSRLTTKGITSGMRAISGAGILASRISRTL